jgi:hypothetical protein
MGAKQAVQVFVRANGDIHAIHTKEQNVPPDIYGVVVTNTVWVDPDLLPLGGAVVRIEPINFEIVPINMNEIQPGWTPATHNSPLSLTVPAGAGQQALNDIGKLAAAQSYISSISDANQQRIDTAKFYHQDWVRLDAFWNILASAISITVGQMDDVFREAIKKIGISDG